MKLLFSGKLNGNYWLDSVAKPGLYVNCTSITNVENNYTYFEMTKQELLAIEKKKQEEESKRKREQRIKEGYCLLPGCSNKGQGWKYYNTSQGSAFGMDFIGCVRKYSTGGCCSKSHCAEYEANY